MKIAETLELANEMWELIAPAVREAELGKPGTETIYGNGMTDRQCVDVQPVRRRANQVRRRRRVEV